MLKKSTFFVTSLGYHNDSHLSTNLNSKAPKIKELQRAYQKWWHIRMSHMVKKKNYLDTNRHKCSEMSKINNKQIGDCVTWRGQSEVWNQMKILISSDLQNLNKTSKTIRQSIAAIKKYSEKYLQNRKKTWLRVNLRPRVDLFKMKLRNTMSRPCLSRPCHVWISCHLYQGNVMFVKTNLIYFDSISSNLIQYDPFWSILIQPDIHLILHV